jgi:hypothetical protein
MMSHERAASIAKIIRTIGWTIFLLLAVSRFDFSLLSKHSVADGKISVRNTGLRTALPELTSSRRSN